MGGMPEKLNCVYVKPFSINPERSLCCGNLIPNRVDAWKVGASKMQSKPGIVERWLA